MALVADKAARSELSPEERAMLDRILRLRLTQQKRVFELVELFQKAEDQEEAAEIGEALAEMLFRDPEDLAATILTKERSKGVGEVLRKHRGYVAEQIRKRRQKLKMSQEELAEKAGISQSHVCRLETGKHAPSYLTMERLAKAMNVKPSQLDPGFSDD